MIPMSHYLFLSSILFSISLAGIFLNRKKVYILFFSLKAPLQNQSKIMISFVSNPHSID